MKSVLVVGSGGREHAIARVFAKSSKVDKIYLAPGNSAMLADNDTNGNKFVLLDIAQNDVENLAKFAKDHSIYLTFVGSETSLDAGIADIFEKENLKIVGAKKSAAKLESSKNFAKFIMDKAGVKSAKYRYFNINEIERAKEFIREIKLPFVIKADGLMAGKGVVIPKTMQEADDTIAEMFENKKMPILIEEFLEGVEFSYFALVNQTHIIPIGSACDYKRSMDNDEGLNTGGMGSFAPVSWVSEKLQKDLIENIIKPVANEMVKQGNPFSGVLYAGLILTKNGVRVIEFNTRFGDPETQVLLDLIENDFMDIMDAYFEKKDIEIKLKKGLNLGVVLAAQGYPRDYVKNIEIYIPESLFKDTFFAGLKYVENEKFISTSGRILLIKAFGKNIDEARNLAYEKISKIKSNNTFLEMISA